MSVYRIKREETFRADTEREAARVIDEAKASNKFILAKFTSVKKEAKQKGEVVDEWYRVTLTQVYDSEKEPVGDPIAIDFEEDEE